jgi:hypothetical protein
MGLLDGFFSDDPQKVAQMAMALGLLGGAPNGRKNFAADLSNAGLLGMSAYGTSKAAQARLAEEAQQHQMRGMQMDQMQRALQDQTHLRSLLSGGGTSPFEDSPAPQGPTPQAAPPQAPPTGNPGQSVQAPQQLVPGAKQPAVGAPTNSKLSVFQQLSNVADRLEQGGLPERALEYRSLAEKYRPEVKDTKTLMKDGQRVTVNIFKDGTQEVVPFSPDQEKAHFADTGNAVLPLDPFTGRPVGNAIAKSVTPDAAMSNATARAGQAQTEAHFQAGGNQYDPERGVLVNTRTGNASPVTQGGAPMPARVSDSVKNELAKIDSEAGIINGAIKAVEKTPSAFGFQRGAATLAGTLPESIAGRMDSSDERQSRSYLFNTVSKVINERAGAAQSAQELARLRSFLPGETDSAPQILDKMKSYQNYLKEKRDGYAGSASKSQSQSSGWSIKPIS